MNTYDPLPISIRSMGTDATRSQVEERLTLHELIRVGFGRGEDLQLLQAVVTRVPAPLPAASQQLLRECQLREEWRCLNEAKLLAQVQATNFVSVNDAARLELASKVQQALQQMRGRRALPQTFPKLPASSPGSAKTSSAAPGGTVGDCRGLAAASRPKSALLPIKMALTPTKPPRSSGNHASKQLLTPQQLRNLLGARVLSPANLTQHTLDFNSSSLTPDQHPKQQPLKGSGQDRDRVNCMLGSGGHSSGESSSGGSVPHGLSHVDLHGGTRSAAAPPGVPAQEPPPPPPHRGHNHHKQQLLQQQQQHRLSSPVLAQPKQRPRSACLPSKPPHTGGRFEKFLRLQSGLVEGLQQHATSGGTQSALQALQQSVVHMQAHFQACLVQSSEVLGVLVQQQGGSMGALPKSSNPRGWYQLLLLGQLGLTPSDTARLQHLRKQQAARAIQRVVRQFLPAARHRRQVKAARERAQALAQQLRYRAATIIQCHWRCHMGRRQAAALYKQWLEQSRKNTVRNLVLRLAATRIQRAWRLHQKRLHGARVLTLAGPSDPGPGNNSMGVGRKAKDGPESNNVVLLPPGVSLAENGDTYVNEIGGHRYPVSQQRGVAGKANESHSQGLQGPQGESCFLLEPAAKTAHTSTASRQGHSPRAVAHPDAMSLQAHNPPSAACCHHDTQAHRQYQEDWRYSPQQEAAAVCVQAAVRGWLCRRSQELWWKHCSRDIRGRRNMGRLWRAHQQFMTDTYKQQGQILEVLQQQVQVSQATLLRCAAERAQFEVAWQRWMEGQCSQAMARPLPKGWVPFTRPKTEEACFLDTRTGAMHAHHPALLQLQPFALQERSRAEEQLMHSEAVPAQYLHMMHQQSELLQRSLLQSLIVKQL